MDVARFEKLAKSDDMVPVQGAVEVDVPADVLWELFARPNLWRHWNRCFLWAHNDALIEGERLVWCFKPIARWYPYVMPAVANIIEVVPGKKVTWEVDALPGFYAHHTYSIEALPGGRSRFRSWEKATGPLFARTRRFWLAHFTFVKDRSLEGALELERIYRRDGNLYRVSDQGNFLSHVQDDALTALSMSAPLWFFTAYVKSTAVELAPGVHAVLGGGGNSLVVEDSGEALLVDTKFPPGSGYLARWVKKNIDAKVTTIVNTHYHYDHTQGNENYPQARVIAHERAADYMLQQDGEFWNDHRAGLPNAGVSDRGETLRVGNKLVRLIYPGPAHTRADLVVYLPGEDILATGDLFFHTYYPFFDLSRAGVALPGIIDAIRRLADMFPSAQIVPGHGPLATTDELLDYASYLEDLTRAVQQAIDAGQTEQEAASSIDLSRYERKILPSFHDNRLSWGTAENNVRNVHRALTARRAESRDSDRGALAEPRSAVTTIAALHGNGAGGA